MQATWLDTGMPVLFTTALAVCSLEPVTTITIQGVLHVVCGVLLSVCNVARDVNLSDILQPSLCDVTCETVTDLMTAHVNARRGLCMINVLGVDLVDVLVEACVGDAAQLLVLAAGAERAECRIVLDHHHLPGRTPSWDGTYLVKVAAASKPKVHLCF